MNVIVAHARMGPNALTITMDTCVCVLLDGLDQPVMKVGLRVCLFVCLYVLLVHAKVVLNEWLVKLELRVLLSMSVDIKKALKTSVACQCCSLPAELSYFKIA